MRYWTWNLNKNIYPINAFFLKQTYKQHLISQVGHITVVVWRNNRTKPIKRKTVQHTCNLIGFTPSKTRRSKRDWASPARAAFLHIITGPSWQWSPTRTTCKKKLFTKRTYEWVRNSSQANIYIKQDWQSGWMPLQHTCFAPSTNGIRHSGSVAWVDSSIST